MDLDQCVDVGAESFVPQVLQDAEFRRRQRNAASGVSHLMRVHVDDRTERMNMKIREAQLEKIPYMLVVGDKEIASSAVSIRLRTGEDLGSQPVSDFMKRVNRMVKGKSCDTL